MIRQQISKIKSVFNTLRKNFIPEIYWLSLGENCLPDDILKRHGLKSFSTIYSSGRSNIDYALLLEKSKYQGFLDKENWKYDFIGNLRVTRSTLINECDNIFSSYHMLGFEATHHDLISNQEHKQSYERKIARMLELRDKKKTVFLYHHRINKNTDLESLFNKLETFTTYYNKKPKMCQVVVFIQNVTSDPKERKVNYRKISTNIHLFEFSSLNIWEGADPDIFWARGDDDLIEKMLDTSVRIIKNRVRIPNGTIY